MRTLISLFWALIAVILTLALVFVLILSATDIVPDQLNPFRPLDFAEKANFLTEIKLRRALARRETCLAALETAHARYEPRGDFIDPSKPNCQIENRIILEETVGVGMKPLDTTCATALRLTAWLQYSVKPDRLAADRRLSHIEHRGSYNCRMMRTSSGESNRLSKHATAEAVDIAGFIFENDEALTLLQDWDGPAHDYLQSLNRSACQWFPLVLGPNYNSLHKDHFHLEIRGLGTCR